MGLYKMCRHRRLNFKQSVERDQVGYYGRYDKIAKYKCSNCGIEVTVTLPRPTWGDENNEIGN